jgi:hypothetical protein
VAVRLVALRCKRLSGGDAELLGDEIDAGDLLRHRVFDLDAAVQLEEEELTSGDHELRRAGAAIADRLREGDRRLADPRAQAGVERRGR